MDDYLSKPISPKETEACLHRWRSPSSATITVRHTGTLSTSAINLVSHETKLTVTQTLQHRTRAIPTLILIYFKGDAAKLVTQLQESVAR